MLIGAILIAIFLIYAGLMYTNRLSAILALPLMAFTIALAGRIPPDQILTQVISEGATRLSPAIITVIFGAMLGQLVFHSGMAEVVIKKTAELGGDRPLVVSLGLTLLIAILFTVLGGLGAVVMVGTITIPIMLSLGLPHLLAGSLFLMGLCLGGLFNLANWQIYISVLGLTQQTIFQFALIFGAAFAVMIVVFAVIESKRMGRIYLWAEMKKEPAPSLPAISLLTPILPIVLVLGFSVVNLINKPEKPFEFPIIAAMAIGLAYGTVTLPGQWKDKLNLLTKSMFEGIANVAPAVVLMMGIGMVLNAVMNPLISLEVAPLIQDALPNGALGYILVFGLLAPLSLYRGPLNIWGMGSGLVGLLLASGALPAHAIMAALISVGQIQGVSDPTNTHNVWIANFVNVDVQAILKRTLPYMWILAIIGLGLASIAYL